MAGDREGSEVFLMKKTPVALPTEIENKVKHTTKKIKK